MGKDGWGQSAQRILPYNFTVLHFFFFYHIILLSQFNFILIKLEKTKTKTGINHLNKFFENFHFKIADRIIFVYMIKKKIKFFFKNLKNYKK